jgi:hypothetical protein
MPPCPETTSLKLGPCHTANESLPVSSAGVESIGAHAVYETAIWPGPGLPASARKELGMAVPKYVVPVKKNTHWPPASALPMMVPAPAWQ